MIIFLGICIFIIATLSFGACCYRKRYKKEKLKANLFQQIIDVVSPKYGKFGDKGGSCGVLTEIENLLLDSRLNQVACNSNVVFYPEVKELYLYNPQRYSFGGLISLLQCLDSVDFEYYIGKNSPLADYYRIDCREVNNGACDTKGVCHVNLMLSSEDVTLNFLIDRQYEEEVIEAIYMALTHNSLRENALHNHFLKRNTNVVSKILKFLGHSSYEFSNRV